MRGAARAKVPTSVRRRMSSLQSDVAGFGGMPVARHRDTRERPRKRGEGFQFVNKQLRRPMGSIGVQSGPNTSMRQHHPSGAAPRISRGDKIVTMLGELTRADYGALPPVERRRLIAALEEAHRIAKIEDTVAEAKKATTEPEGVLQRLRQGERSQSFIRDRVHRPNHCWRGT